MGGALGMKYVVREVQLKNKNNEYTKAIIIGIQKVKTGIIYPSPLTNFIKAYYRSVGKSLSTQSNPANEVCKFLNYVLDKIQYEDSDFIELKSQGIFGLNPLHGSRYITYKTREGLQSKTVKRIERYLTNFYLFLEEEKIIVEFDKRKKRNYRDGKDHYASPFRHVSLETEFPKEDDLVEVENELKDFGKNRLQILTEIIMTALVVHPEIALGLCFQFLGGLRRSEVINLTKLSLQTSGDYGSDKFVLIVRDNQNKLFPHLKNTRNEQVKRPRNQTLLLCGLLSDVYKEHIEIIKKLELKKKLKNNIGLFISPRTGQPMSGENYADKFDDIKRAYLEKLIQERRFDDYERLNTKWATHIGRGVFTNYLMSLGMNVTQVAIARGDRNLNSALEYFENRNLIENMENALKEIEEAYKKQESNIEISHIARWKELYRIGSRI